MRMDVRHTPGLVFCVRGVSLLVVAIVELLVSIERRLILLCALLGATNQPSVDCSVCFTFYGPLGSDHGARRAQSTALFPVEVSRAYSLCACVCLAVFLCIFCLLFGR